MVGIYVLLTFIAVLIFRPNGIYLIKLVLSMSLYCMSLKLCVRVYLVGEVRDDKRQFVPVQQSEVLVRPYVLVPVQNEAGVCSSRRLRLVINYREHVRLPLYRCNHNENMNVTRPYLV